MPKIEKQNPTAKRPSLNGAAAGSVLSEAIDVGQLEDDFIKILIYGQNRTGKSTLACQFPKPLLLVSFEPTASGGARSVKLVPGVKLLRLQSTEKAFQLASELRSKNPFETVVIDSATSMQDIVLKEILDLPDVPTQLNWGTATRDQYRERSEKTRELLRPFLELQCHIVVTAKERDHNPPDKEKPEMLRGFQLESYLAADLGGATVGWLHDAMDYITRLYLDKERKVIREEITVAGKKQVSEHEVETGKIVRRLRTMYHPNYAAGFRSERPQDIPEFLESPTYEKIAALIRGR